MITSRALGVYYYLKGSGANISAESLSRVFPEGRKVFLSVLKELREVGLISTTRETVNGKFVTVSRLTDGSPKTELLLQQYEQNSNLILNAYSLKSLERVHGGAVKGANVEDYSLGRYEVDEDDRQEQIRKARKKTQDDYAELKTAEATRKSEAKSAQAPIDWSTDASVYEFADRMGHMWNVQPWTTARTRFKGAFAKCRKIHSTNGEIELKMMDRFFAGLEHQKHINDPEVIWKMFIKNYASILLDVERSTVTQEDIAVAEDISARQMERF